jgi:hypothetical protein
MVSRIFWVIAGVELGQMNDRKSLNMRACQIIIGF